MFWLISFLVSVLVFGTILLCSHEQVITRKANISYWKYYNWVDKGEGRHKFPLWLFIVALMVAAFPILNIIAIIAAIAAYSIQAMRRDYADGVELEDYRYVLRGKVINWIIKLFTKKI